MWLVRTFPKEDSADRVCDEERPDFPAIRHPYNKKYYPVFEIRLGPRTTRRFSDQSPGVSDYFQFFAQITQHNHGNRQALDKRGRQSAKFARRF